MSRVMRLLWTIVDGADYCLTVARLSVLDWLFPPQETPLDRAIREEGERLRRAFPWLDERTSRTPIRGRHYWEDQ
jgi:hypothetical protein